MCNAGKRFSSAEERKSLVFLKFLVFCGTEESEKNFLSFLCCSLEHSLSLSGVLSDRLSRRINQISLHSYSRKSIALFHKGVFIYQNAVISVTLLFLSRHRREREREQKAQILSLLKKEIED